MAEPPRACCKSEMQFICLGEDGRTSLQTLKLATVCTGAFQMHVGEARRCMGRKLSLGGG